MKTILCKCGESYDARSKTKMCRKCYLEFKSLNKKPYRGGSQFKSSDGKTHYEKNKKYYSEQVKIRRRDLLNFVNDYKKQHPCVDCGNDDYRVLEFDHISNNKVKAVATAVRYGWSTESLLSEINKCEVRCANCHRIKTHERRTLKPI